MFFLTGNTRRLDALRNAAKTSLQFIEISQVAGKTHKFGAPFSLPKQSRFKNGQLAKPQQLLPHNRGTSVIMHPCPENCDVSEIKI